jgi:hypothetical protein
VSTINQFLNHARFLNDETLDFFAAQNVKKDFFEEAQKKRKKELSTRMTGEGKSHEEMTAQISDDVRKSYEEYLLTGEISPIMGTRENEAEDTHPEIQIPQVTVPRMAVPKVFNPWYGNESEDEEDSLEGIKRDVEASAQRLLESATLSDPDQFEKCVREEIKRLCRIPHRLSTLKDREIRRDSCHKEVLPWAN